MQTRRIVLTGTAALALAASTPLPLIAKPPHRPRILYVESEPAVAGVVAKLLSADGYDVIPASTGKDALRIVAGQHRLDLMIISGPLPDMGMLKTAGLARRWLGPAVPMLLLSPRVQDGVYEMRRYPGRAVFASRNTN